MGRPRKPTALHKLSGSAEKNPGRMREREGEPVDTRPLGPPPDTWPPERRAVWLELGRLAPWLVQADRIAVEITAQLLLHFRISGASMPATLVSRLESMLARLGLTPSDRSRVKDPGPGSSSNPFSQHGRRPK